MFRAEAGPNQPGLQKLIDLLRHGAGRAWVKLTGTYRMATGPTFADAAPMARALIAAAPDRLIWGSDYPHLSFADKVGSVQLFNLLADWAPDEATRRRILVDNTAALLGFSR
jgi:predicted TIM-barrel fold metal-dependent hydrolase